MWLNNEINKINNRNLERSLGKHWSISGGHKADQLEDQLGTVVFLFSAFVFSKVGLLEHCKSEIVSSCWHSKVLIRHAGRSQHSWAQNWIQVHGHTRNCFQVSRRSPNGMVGTSQIPICCLPVLPKGGSKSHLLEDSASHDPQQWRKEGVSPHCHQPGSWMATHWKRLHAYCSHFPWDSLYQWVKGVWWEWDLRLQQPTSGVGGGGKAPSLPLPPHPCGTFRTIMLWLKSCCIGAEDWWQMRPFLGLGSTCLDHP